MFQLASSEETWMVGFLLFWKKKIEFGFSNGPLSICATLEDQAAQSNIRLFCTSSQVLTIDSQDNEDHSSEDDKMTLKTEKKEKKRMIYHSKWWVHRSSGFQPSCNNPKSSFDKHERTHRHRIVRWKRLWFKWWRGAYLNARWSQYPKRRRRGWRGHASGQRIPKRKLTLRTGSTEN